MADKSTRDEVGIRELKAQASAVVRRAAAGEVITITDRGRPVARLVPIRDDEGWWEQMAEEGRIIPARRDLIQVLYESPPARLGGRPGVLVAGPLGLGRVAAHNAP